MEEECPEPRLPASGDFVLITNSSKVESFFISRCRAVAAVRSGPARLTADEGTKATARAARKFVVDMRRLGAR